MKFVAIVIAFLAAICASPSVAQPIAPAGYGPYRLGMTADEVRATAPSAAWRVEAQHGYDSLMGGPVQRVADMPFVTELMMKDDRVFGIAMMTFIPMRDPDQCLLRGMILGSELAPAFGAFDDVAMVLEPSQEPSEVRRGEDGSVWRVYVSDTGKQGFANARHASFASVRAAAGPAPPEPPYNGAPSCRLEILITNDPRPPRAPPGPSLAELMQNAPSADELARAEMVAHAQWTARPTGSDFSRYYPERAADAGLSGQTVLDCIVAEEQRLRCRIAEETPADQEFGLAALRIAQSFRMAATIDGAPTLGKRVRVPIRFNITN